MYIHNFDRKEVDVWNISKSKSSRYIFCKNKLTVD